MMNRKGLSEVIATVTLILLTVAAASLLAGFIVPYARTNLAKTECFSYKDYFYFDEENGYNCYNNSAATYKLYAVSVGAQSSNTNAPAGVNGFRLAFESDNSSEVLELNNGSVQSSDNKGVRMLEGGEIIKLPVIGELKTYILNTTGTYSTVKVFPILKDGRTCGDPSDQLTLKYSCEYLNLKLN